MQTLLTAAQMRMADDFTIANKPIASVALMERAAEAFFLAFITDEPDRSKSIAVFCGKGNNGGDGLVIARLLYSRGYTNLKVFIPNFSAKQSNDFLTNLWRLQETPVDIVEITEPDDIKAMQAVIIIDAILGSGLNKALEGKFEQLVQIINDLNRKVYAVDVPTGFFADGQLPEDYNGIKAFKTICFQRPKINFFFPESVRATEHFEVLDIGLDENYIQSQPSYFRLVEASDIQAMLKPRKAFSHKGTYGHALLIAGNTNTMGAALLASKGCLYAGAGLTTACIPASGLIALNTALPEVMALPRVEHFEIDKPEKYLAIAIGSGLGTTEESKNLLERVLDLKKALILDADALNLMAQHPALQEKVSAGSILTPHMKEFDHLFGAHANWYDRLQTGRKQAAKLSAVIVLKNQYTFVIDVDGMVYVNPTGNPAMAQGGMGDVLTGVIAAYAAQGLPALHAALTACYFHGKAGDDLAEDHFNVTASQVAENLPAVVQRLLTK
jgi:hydroxyethylthiazole kinase-like uncharacterized protein yjeF